MQMTYHITCKCGHDFPIPARFLSTDEEERAALIKALERLLCPNCIQAAIDELHALRAHLLKSGAVPPDITEVGWRTLASDARRDILREDIIPPSPREHTILAWIDRWNRHHPVGTEVLVTQAGEEQPDNLLAFHTYLTTSPAKLLAGKPVVEVSGLGPIDLDRLIPFFA